MKTCRVILSTRCNLDCTYCCNKLPEVQATFKMTTLNQLCDMHYDVINLTGGELALDCGKFHDVVLKIEGKRTLEFNPKIYAYTNGIWSIFRDDAGCFDSYIAKYINGVNIGLHDMCTLKTIGYTIDHYNDNFKTWNLTCPIRLHVNDLVYKANKQIIDIFHVDHRCELNLWKMNECNNTKEDRWII